MIALLLWLFVVLHLFLLDGLLYAAADLVGGFQLAPPLTLCMCLYLALFARTSALPGLLLCAALARSVFLVGPVAWHLLVLGLPIAVLLPLRSVLSNRSPLWQCVAAGMLAYVLPRVSGLLFRLTQQGDAEGAPTALGVFLAMCVVPILTRLLRSVPPASLFLERAE